MSHIMSFEIDGLAGRSKPLAVKLNRDTNIFFGLNGSGKTSLLKILHAAMANDTEILDTVPFKSAKVQIYSLKYENIFTRSIEKKGRSSGRGAKGRKVVHREIRVENEVVLVQDPIPMEELEWSCTPKTPKKAKTTSWAHTYLPTSRLHVTDEPNLLYSERISPIPPYLTEQQLDHLFARSVEHLWSRYSAQVLGDVRKAQEKGLASILRAVLAPQSASNRRKNKLTSEAAYDRVLSFLKRQGADSILGKRTDFEQRYTSNSTLQDVVKDIDLVEDKIRKAMTSRDALQELITRLFMANKKVQFTDDSIEVTSLKGEKIGLASLSSGEKHLLRILVDTLLVGESLLIIDEPEISMHVDWQKDLIKSMRSLNPKAQLVLATHSPEIMADVSDEMIFRI